MKLRNVLSLLLLITIMGCGAQKNKRAQGQSSQDPEEYVEQASFTNLQGDNVHVSDFEGKVVLIDFWETWCKPCIASFPTLEKLKQEYPQDFAVLAVTPGFSDTRNDAKSFVSENDYSFKFVMDSNKLSQKLGVQSIPYKVFVDAEGNFMKSSLGSYGPDQDYKKIKKIIEKHQKGKQNSSRTQ